MVWADQLPGCYVTRPRGGWDISASFMPHPGGPIGPLWLAGGRVAEACSSSPITSIPCCQCVALKWSGWPAPLGSPAGLSLGTSDPGSTYSLQPNGQAGSPEPQTTSRGLQGGERLPQPLPEEWQGPTGPGAWEAWGPAPLGLQGQLWPGIVLARHVSWARVCAPRGDCLPAQGPGSFVKSFHSNFILGTHSPFLYVFCVVAYTVKFQSTTGHIFSEYSLPCISPPRDKGMAVGWGGGPTQTGSLVIALPPLCRDSGS